MAYVYQHIRLDRNEVFYVGIGSGKNYKRAYNFYNRTKFWKSIANKSKYKVEILNDNISWDDACNIEKELIKKYGRKNLNKGTLVNLTDGGEGSIGIIISKEQREAISKRMIGKKMNLGYKHTKENKIKIGIASKNRIIKDETKEKLSRLLKGNKNNLGKKLSQETKNKISAANKGKAISKKTIEAAFNANWKGYVYQIDKVTNKLIAKYKTANEANKATKINLGDIKSVIIGKRKSAGGFKWQRNYEN